MIAFLGMGLLGSNFVRALRKHGQDVHVWNRSAAKATALEAEGARAFADPAGAVRGATRIHLTLGVPPAEAATLFDHFNPGTTITARARRMIEASYSEPSWELAMARKDARLMLETGARLAMLPAIAARMDVVISQGHGGDDWTV